LKTEQNYNIFLDKNVRKPNQVVLLGRKEKEEKKDWKKIGKKIRGL